jgi:hypothetical protein
MNDSWDILSFNDTDSASLEEVDSDLSLSNATTDEIDAMSTSELTPSPTAAPAWMVEFVQFRQRLFLQTVEPMVVRLLGPALPENHLHLLSAPAYQQARAAALSQHHDLGAAGDPFQNITAYGIHNHTPTTPLLLPGNLSGAEFAPSHRRQLGFLPDYVEDASSFRETSMSFATLITLFATMASILLIFLSCFYHNQK